MIFSRQREGNPNLDIWLRNQTTDTHVDGPNSPKTHKPITGKDYGGTSLAPLYVVMRLTQEFGPVGEGWGITVDHEEYVKGEPYFDANGAVVAHELIHKLRAEMWWRRPDQEFKNYFNCYGGTRAFYRTSKGGFKSDEDAAKKSLTDALTKGASYLGIGADIHLGQWDDSKYRETVERQEEQRHAGIQAEEKVAVIENSLAQCEDATALRAYLGQERLQHWIGVQARNHPHVHSKVLALIEQTRQRVEPDGVPEEEDPPQEATPPALYSYQSSGGDEWVWDSLQKWKSEWRLRIRAIQRAKKPAAERYLTLGGMVERNSDIMHRLHNVDDVHADAVVAISREATLAQAALRALGTDSLEPVQHNGGKDEHDDR